MTKMKALLIVTGRGMGGDAVIGLNTAEALNKLGFEVEFALDSKAPGLLFKKNNLSWYKIDIPQSGGHASTKKTKLIAGLKLVKAIFKGIFLIKRVKPDIVVGIIGGGAVLASIASKISRTPAISIVNTPVDSKLSLKFNSVIALTESPLYNNDIHSNSNSISSNDSNEFFNVKGKKVFKSFYPLKIKEFKGNKENALLNLPDKFDKSKKTILFSSGSSLFEMMAKGVNDFSKFTNEFNIIVVGYPLKEEYNKYLEEDNIINLSYIDWLNDLYEIIDLAVLTDDGVMVQEAIALGLPIIALNRVKYGRYHNIEAIFPGAVIESDLEDLNQTIITQINNLNKIRECSNSYRQEVINSSSKIANIIYSIMKN
ncbi:MAG: glycosyltransferase [Methanobrevibacter sp.]|jgi:UDP-N-acetylglucosamine--N-acetylmuramyl-(pentapeptide) pyrophosphoryl-undecaprenol N-acetylglucosamine transferase|nr:glycosyltransferase [Methanobrevibacter sp.]